MKSLFVFDLDGTLAESKSSADDELAKLFMRLLALVKVAVISGGSWEQFEKQLLSNLSSNEGFKNLFLLPTCGTKFFRYADDWTTVYSDDLTSYEKDVIMKSLDKALSIWGFKPGRVWGEVIEDRGSQITFSALGQEAPLTEKRGWDTDTKKRLGIISVLEPLLPNFSIRIGGTTSIDITKPGIDKAYGIRKLRDILSIPVEQMLFVGDALFPGGNDYPVKGTGVTCIQNRDHDETKRIIETALACLAP